MKFTDRYSEVSLAKAPMPEGIASAMFGYFGLTILHLSLIPCIVLIFYWSVRLIAGSVGLILSIPAILAALFEIGLSPTLPSLAALTKGY